MLKRTLLFGITSVCAALGLSLSYLLSESFPNINPVIMNIIFFTIPSALAIAATVICDLISPIVSREKDSVYKSCMAFACVIAVFGTAIVSGGMQFLYRAIDNGGATNVVLMIDTSASMTADRLREAKSSAKELIKQANKNDRFAVVTFDQNCKTLTNGFVKITDQESKRKLTEDINNTEAGGGTNLDGALQMVLDDILAEEKSAGVFIISDAETAIANETVDAYIDKGDFSVSTLLITESESEDTGVRQLRQFAEKTGGTFKTVKDTTQISSLYNEMLKDYKIKNQGGLYAPRDISEDGLDNIYLLLIQIFFYLMPGVVMAAAYTILFNRRDVRVWYCALGGIICTVGVILNCAFLQLPLLNVAFFVLMYPAVATGGFDRRQECNEI